MEQDRRRSALLKASTLESVEGGEGQGHLSDSESTGDESDEEEREKPTAVMAESEDATSVTDGS